MNKGMMWALVVVALLVGAYAGYAYEKNKLVSMMNSQQASYQTQIEALKKSAGENKMAGQKNGSAMKNNLIMMPKSPTLGTYITAANDMTLYTFNNDSPNKSNCEGSCAVIWPPYLASGVVPSPLPSHMGTIQRPDGSTQYTWDEKPLYYYSKDKKVGDTNGDGFGGVWHVAK